jgi:hypothetical protein
MSRDSMALPIGSMSGRGFSGCQDMPGIGPNSAEKLEKAKIRTPVQLMGQFMVAAFMAELVSAAAAWRVHHLSLHLCRSALSCDVL